MEHFHHAVMGYCTFERLYADQVKAAPTDRPSLFIELGTFCGKSAAYLAVEVLNSGKPITVHTWDSWDGWIRHQPARFDALRVLAEANLEPVREVLTVKTGDAIAAAAEYPDETVDFVFLDDTHKYDHVLKECAAWWPKVRPGGLMAGHDWNWKPTRKAVETWAAGAGLPVVADKKQLSWMVRK